MDDVEEWAAVSGYEGIYEVSTDGRVRSVPRKRRTGRGWRTVRARILRPKPGQYPSVTLRHLGDPVTHNVHALVLFAFAGPRPPGMEACHGDGDKWNCRLTNLRWDTLSGNHRDRVAHGVSNRGERSGTAKLTLAQVVEIRSKRAGGHRQIALAREYGVFPSEISHIVHRKAWRHAGS